MSHAVDAPPPTQAKPVTEVLHGVEITDPYRWLEDQNSPRTRKWLEEQAAYTCSYFDAIPDREPIRTRVSELLALKEVISEPWNVGERYFYLKRHGFLFDNAEDTLSFKSFQTFNFHGWNESSR